jgi:hypothetical protein
MAKKNLRRRRAPVKKTAPRPELAINVSPFSKGNAFSKDLRRRLELIHDVVLTVDIALRAENCEHGLDFANVLTRLAADPLWDVIERLGGADLDEDKEDTRGAE